MELYDTEVEKLEHTLDLVLIGLLSSGYVPSINDMQEFITTFDNVNEQMKIRC